MSVVFLERLNFVHFQESISQITVVFLSVTLSSKWRSVKKAASSFCKSILQVFFSKTTMRFQYTEAFYAYFPLCHTEYWNNVYSRVEISLINNFFIMDILKWNCSLVLLTASMAVKNIATAKRVHVSAPALIRVKVSAVLPTIAFASALQMSKQWKCQIVS